MSHSSMTTGSVTGEVVSCQYLQINDRRASGIAFELDDEVNIYDLITRGYLDLALQEINRLLRRLDPDGTQLQNLSLISPSSVDPYFGDTLWTLKNWYLSDSEAFCAGGYTDNAMILSRDAFVKAGKYLICIIVSELPSGKLEIRKNGEWVCTFTEKGTYYREITIGDIVADELSIVAVDVSANETAQIYSFSLHYIADRFYAYLTQKIKSLASIDAEGFVPREEYTHTLDTFLEQFQTATKMYLEDMVKHTSAHNPHCINCAMIGAATEDHVHENYITATGVAKEVEKTMLDYSKLQHTHPEYLTAIAANALITTLLQEYIADMISVDPLIVTKAPMGILPSRYAQTDISNMLPILIPSTIAHNEETSYDHVYGICTTNREELMHEVYKAFSVDADTYASIPSSLDLAKGINLRICYHSYRKVSGYRIRCIGALPTSWAVYSSNTLFLHRVTDPQNYKEEGSEKVCEIFFERTEQVESLAFIFEYIKEITGANWQVKIEIIYEDFDLTCFGITDAGFQFCVPTKGTNRLVEVYPSVGRTILKPAVLKEDLPLYVFGGRELGEAEVSFNTSYYTPEYSNVRRGLNTFLDKFNSIPRDLAEISETYRHPAFGILRLQDGESDPTTSLTNIYSSSTNGWRSNRTTRKVTIEQTFFSDHVVLSGYMLNWRNEDAECIPEKWTLTAEGLTEAGATITVVLDSAEQFYPFYSVEDDDIVYHKTFDKQITVKKLTLVMETTRDDLRLGLNKLYLFASEYFYSIPQNVMFYGLKEVSQMCIGYVAYKGPKIGWKPTNMCFGKSCVIPVNNMKETEPFTEYTVPNPFFTTDVVTSVQNYVLQQDSSKTPSAYITSVAADKITVFSENSFRYAVSISRTW